jgi:hypothetical protein
MPASEAEDEFISLTSAMMLEAVAGSVVASWKRFGQLLQERLGWHDYPECAVDTLNG